MEGHGILCDFNSIQQLGFVAKWNFLGGHNDLLETPASKCRPRGSSGHRYISFPNLAELLRYTQHLFDSGAIFSSRRRGIQMPTARIVFLRFLVFIIVVMMFAERGPTKTRHDFVEKQIKKDDSTYSSTRQMTTERNIRRRTDLEVLLDVSSPRSEKGH